MLGHRIARVLFAASLLTSFAHGARSDPTEIEVTYDLSEADVSILSLRFDVIQGDGAYRVAALIRSTGFADVLSRYQLVSDSRGSLDGDRVEPQTYTSDSRSRIRQRLSRLQYSKDAGILVSLDPPAEGETLPTQQQIKDSVDPLAGLLQESLLVGRDGHCTGRIPIFDGRRRYDLVYRDEGADQIQAAEQLPYSGAARRCKIDLVKIAGFEAGSTSEQPDHATVWIAPLRPHVALPVKLEFSSSFGMRKVALSGIR